MHNIIFLTLSPFTSRDYNRFGIDILNKNFKIFIFDMTALYRPDYIKSENENHQLNLIKCILQKPPTLNTNNLFGLN